jgi:hypothetical protein
LQCAFRFSGGLLSDRVNTFFNPKTPEKDQPALELNTHNQQLTPTYATAHNVQPPLIGKKRKAPMQRFAAHIYNKGRMSAAHFA